MRCPIVTIKQQGRKRQGQRHPFAETDYRTAVGIAVTPTDEKYVFIRNESHNRYRRSNCGCTCSTNSLHNQQQMLQQQRHFPQMHRRQQPAPDARYNADLLVSCQVECKYMHRVYRALFYIHRFMFSPFTACLYLCALRVIFDCKR
jgi:hypothetical protein